MTLKMHMVALAAASAMFIGGASFVPAKAADLGGDCCADLEERVAELEATAARKGNKKVSLSISGWVARELYAWDDGDMSDAYVVDTSLTLATHFKFAGKANIKPGWDAGFNIHVETRDNGSISVNQLSDGDPSDTNLGTLEAYWYLSSERLGRLSVGQQSQASDNAAILADFSGSLVQSNWVLFDGAGFFLRPEGGPSGAAGLEGNTWGTALGNCSTSNLGIGADCNGLPTDSIRYDSPAFGGFIVSASWGENDFWDTSIRYSGEWNSVKVKAVAAYNWYGDVKGASDDRDGEYFQIGAMAMHTPSGLFLYGAYGKEWVNDAFIETGADTLQAVEDGDHFFLKGGIRKQWNSLGHTVLYGEYGQYNDMYGGFSCSGADNVSTSAIGASCLSDGVNISGSEIERYGLGVVQEIDSAAMAIWAKWVRLEGEIDFTDREEGANLKQEYEALDNFLVGAMISF